MKKYYTTLTKSILQFLFVIFFIGNFNLVYSQQVVNPLKISNGVFLGVTIPLRDMPVIEDMEQNARDKAIAKQQMKKYFADHGIRNVGIGDKNYSDSINALGGIPDPVWQNASNQKNAKAAPFVDQNFAGSTTFSGVPPDCNGAVGPNHFMQTINTSFKIYNKTGGLLAGPTNMNSIFSGVTGSGCNDGDPIIIYDEIADRWLAAEFSICGANDYMLIAVSTTNDPTGTWYKYSFDVDDMPDYMKFGVWRDGYYMSTNSPGVKDVYVFERSVMMVGGASPQMIGFANPNRPASGFHCLMPCDNDWAYASVGAPGMFVTINDNAWGGADQIWLFELQANWVTPASSTFSRVATLAVPAFDSNLGAGLDNIAQAGTTQKLDALNTILMYRAQYINFGGYQTIVCNHTVDVDGTDHAGIRWYELRKAGAVWSVRQSGTYAPDAGHRWMGSISMNQNQEIGLAYSYSNPSTTTYPSLKFTGQSATENGLASGIMDITETIIMVGTGSQTTINRWGDYAEMSVDPVNNRDFWFTSEYGKAGSLGTQIVAFHFPVTTDPPAIDFYGTPLTIYQGQSINYTDISVGSPTIWSWEFEGGTPSTSSAQNPTGIVYNQQGSYRVKLTATNVNGSSVLEKVGYINVLGGYPMSPIWCDDFSVPATWVISTTAPTTDVWAIQTAAPTGTYSGPMGAISSTSGGNYALFDSDAKGAAGDNQWTHLTMATGQNCTNYEAVTLKFIENYRKFYDSTIVYVSTDNFVTRTSYILHAGFANNDATGNGFNNSLDISSAAAGFANVKVRFTFRSTANTMGANAGWAYAWEIDDVCMEGTLPGQSMPNPDFTANKRNIPKGASVNFTDNSAYTTSWSWTFEGGTPGTSTLQNPTNIVYNAQGDYTVTLVGTNANGFVTKTKTDYIHVFYDCKFTSNMLDDDNSTYYFKPAPATWGYVPGHSGVGGTNYTAFADKITMTGFGTAKVKSLAVAVGNADVVGGTTNVTFTVWADAAGIPGAVLRTKVVPVKDLDAGYINIINFAPVAVGTTFWVGFQMTYVASLDTFACYVNEGGIGKTNSAFCYNGTTWTSMQTTFGKTLSLYIEPEYCLDKPAGTPPDADFFADNTEIAPAGTVNFTDQSTGGVVPTAWTWTLTGGTPNTSAVQNPAAVAYAGAGMYNVSLNSTNANGSDLELKGSYIHVAATTTIVNWNFPNNPDNATADPGGIAANNAMTITNWGAPTAQTFATVGATTRCASTSQWNDANATPTTAWSVSFTTVGYTNIKLSSKQSAPLATSPRDFSVYYSVNGGSFQFLTDVHPMTSANWTQGVLNNFQMPSDCDNAALIEVVWYKTSDVGWAGAAVLAASASLIDDISVTGQLCNSLPAAAGVITGSSPVCQGSTGNVYTVPTISGATIYNWSVPVGATITAGNYTNSITVSFAQNQETGNITVYGENICGTGTVSPNKVVTFTALPSVPGGIIGNQAVANGQNGIAYSVGAVAGATSYTWTLPAFGTLASGGTTNNITVNYACPGINGNFSVHGNNACGAGIESYVYPVSIACAVPVADFVADVTNIVAGSTVNFTDLSTNGPTSWSWTFPSGTPGTSTVKNPSVVYNTAGVYDVTLIATNALGNNSMTKTSYITVTPAPVPIVAWNFPNNPDNNIADAGIAANVAKTMSVQGGPIGLIFTVAGATTRCAEATGWNAGSGIKWWEAEFVTTGYGTLLLSSKQTGSATRSARDWKVQYKIGAGGTWTDVPGATVLCAQNNWSSGNLSNIALPVACENVASVYLRWIMTTNLGMSGAVVQAANPSEIDDILVMGLPLSIAPVANFSGTPTSVCVGQTVSYTDLSTNTPTGWSWTFASGTPATSTAQNPTVTYNTAGTYDVSLTATNSSGSDPEVKAGYITVNANVAASVSIVASANPICSGTSVTFTATPTNGGAAPSYQWKLNGVNVGINSPNYTNAALANGNSVTCVMTSNATCATGSPATSNAIVMTVNALPATPTISAGGPTTFCIGGSVTLTSSAGTTYLWSTTATTASISPSTSGSYTVQVTNAAGCLSAASAATVVTVNALPATPTITAGGPTTFCAGGSVTLTSSAGTTYLWSTGATTASISPSIAGSYTVRVTNASGCQSASSAATVVTVNALPATPTITAGGPTTFCSGGSVTLTSSAGTTYLWSTGATTANISPSTSGSYTVQVTNAAGCLSVVSVATVVTVNALPATPTITAGGPTTFCTGGSVTLTSSAGTTYLWSTTATTASISPSTSGSYTVQVTNAAGCLSAVSAATVVTVNAIPATPTITAGGSTTFCTGGSVTLTSSVGTSYLWSTGATTASISPSTAGSYTVQVTNASGCQSSASSATVVTVNALPATPTITAGGPTTFCSGGSVTLTSSAGITYLWSTGATTASISPAVSGSYTVRVTNAAGCLSAASAATVVNVNALPATPTITAGGPTTFCTGGSVTLTSSVGTTYLWSTAATTASINPSTSGSYTVQVTNAAGCLSAASAATVVTVNTLPATPTITAGGPTTFCAGGSVTLTSSAGTTYLWSTAATTANISAISSGSYTVQVTNAAGCLSAVSAATVVNVNAAPATPTITAGGPTTFCAGGSVTLTSSAGTTYLWSTGATTASISPSTSGSYTVQVTNAAGCLSAASVATVVTVNALPATPTITAGGPTTFCAGGSVTLTSSAGTTYLWSTGATTASISPSTSGSYTVQVSNAAGCQSAASSATVVTVNAVPATPTITAGGPTTFCAGGNVTLTSSAGTTYLWSTAATTASISPSASGSYTVQVTNAAGCLSAASAATVVTVNAAPVTPTITAGGPTTFCAGGSVTLTSSAGSTYLWSTAATTASIIPSTSGSYTVQVTNAAGCMSAASIATVVTVNAIPAIPTITAGGPTTFCAGGNVTLTSSAGTTYLWSTSATTASISPSSSGSYTVQVTNAAGCLSAASAATVVTVNAAPVTPTITAGGPTTFCSGGNVTLTSSAGTTYLWSTGATTSSISPSTSGSYTVQVTNAAGCLSAASVATVVTVNALPATPTITAGGSTTFCIGGNVTLTSSAGTSYLWSTGATTASIISSTSGSYTVQVTNASGCQSAVSAATTVTVDALPVVNAGTDASIPNGTSTVLGATVTGASPFTYSWSPAGQLVNPLVEDPTTVALVSTTVFTLTATSTITGCSNSGAVTITVTGGSLSSSPTATPNTICSGASVQLDALASGGSGTYTYTWTSVPVGFTSSIATPIANPSVNTTYNLAVNDGFTTVNSSVNVVVNAIPATPTITAGGSTTFCTGGSVTLTSSAGTTYLWSTGATTASISPSTAGSYTVQVTNASGCQSAISAATVVTVNALPATPTITAGGPTTFCAGGSVTLTSSAGITYLWSTGATTASISPAVSGSYTVRVTNAAGCLSAVSAATVVNVNALPATPTITAGGSTIFCTGGSVTLTSSVGTSYLWSTGATTPSISPSTSGGYSVQVTDAAGCQSFASGTSEVTVDALPATPTITAGGSTTFCIGGSVTLTSSVGTTYLWSTGATTASINVTTSGSYTVEITNTAGCQSIASATTVTTENNLPVINAGTDASIPNGTSTILDATVAGDSPFTYSWIPSAQLVNASIEDPTTIALTSTTVFTLTATSTITGCSNSDAVTITITGGPLTSSPTVTPGTICSGSNVQLDALASGGSGSYTYIWTSVPVGFTSSIANPIATPIVNTTYSVAVYDGTNTANSLVSVIVNDLPTVDAGLDQTVCDGNSVILTGSGADSFVWDNGVTDGSSFTQAIGTVTYTLIGIVNGCSNTDQVVVTVNAIPTVDAGLNQTVCVGTSVILAGGGATSYVWDNGVSDGTSFIPTVGSVTYTLTGTTSGCSNYDQVIITVNAIPTVDAGLDQTVCEGTSVTLTGGGATTYTWDNGVTDGTSFTSAVGTATYTLTGTSNGCSNTDQVIVTVNAIPIVDAGLDQTVCEGTSVTLTGGGATSFAWDNGVTDGTSFTQGVGSVTYTLTGTTIGCSNTDLVTVTVNVTPTANAIATDALCNGGTGSISLTPTGGTGTLDYSIDGINYQTSGTFSSLVSGNYSITISDVNLCTAVINSTVSEPNVLALTYTSVDATTGNNGAIDLTVTGGTVSYTFNWTPGAMNTEDISGLSAAIYNVVVTDANGCSATTDITINSSSCTMTASIIGTDISCFGLTDGTADLTIYNATAPVLFNWSNSASTEDLSNLAAGTYTVTATDANNCVANASIVINEPLTLSASAVATDASCGSSDGSVTLTVTGGTGAYSFFWSNGSVTQDLINVSAGSYNVNVTDANGCQTTTLSIVNNIGAPIANFTTQATTCAGSCDGNAFVMASGGTGPYTFIWTYDNHTGSIAANLCAGSYTVSITDANLCVVLATTDITSPDPIAIVANVTSTACGAATGTISLTVTGGTGSYTYNWSNGETTVSIVNLAADSYSVNVLDANNCSANDTVVVTSTGGPTVNVSSNPATCFTTCNGSAFVMAIGGTSPYTYSWSNGQNGQFATNLCQGDYTVSVQDGTGCIVTNIATITSPAEIVASTTSVDESSVGASDGSVNVTVSGGSGSFTFQWSANAGGQTTQNATNLSAGVYSVTVSDASCLVTLTDTVFVITNIPLIANEIVSVFPNPTLGIVNINTNTQIEKVELLDLLGRTMIVDTDKRGNVQIDMSHFTPGVYILSIKTSNKLYTQRILLKD